MTASLYDVDLNVSHQSRSIEELLSQDRDTFFPLSTSTPFLDTYDETFIPADPQLDSGYFWMPPEILGVKLYKIFDTVYTPKGCLYKDGLAVGGSNLFTLSALNDAQASVGNALQAAAHFTSGFLILHANYTTYGHFLLEMIPKIIAYNALSLHVPDLKVVLPGAVPAFVLRWLRLFVPDGSISLTPADTSIRLGVTYVSDMLSTHYAFSTCLKEFVSLTHEQAVARLHAENAQHTFQSDIFLSRNARRSDRPDYRVLENEHIIASRMVELGMTVVSPEDLPLEQQIQMFKSARVVVGELSSALHNCIFSSAGTVVIQLNPFNPVQRRIAASLEHRLTSILADDNKVYGWPQPTTARFAVSPERIERALRLAGCY
jgi:hypothetical protein